ncbi:MAG: hypothetical protein WCT40_02090 [Candidatus Magasanikbacteria bacterium]|jgi:hypothetical protein
MKVKDLHLADWNPRQISDSSFSLLKTSLADLGDLSGIIFNRATGNLIGGHQRVKWLLEIAPDAEVVITDLFEQATDSKSLAGGYIEAKGNRFAYREVEWPPEREKLANLAANNISGGWEIDKLGLILRELAEKESELAKLEGTGFNKEFLTDFIQNGNNLRQLLTANILDRCSLQKNNVGVVDTVLTDDYIPNPSQLEQPEFSENIETEHTCPKCGYKFN